LILKTCVAQELAAQEQGHPEKKSWTSARPTSRFGNNEREQKGSKKERISCLNIMLV
jgi:hypothetical protein